MKKSLSTSLLLLKPRFNYNTIPLSSFDIMVGCDEEPRPNPIEEMTEEQKEYEAEKLVKIIYEMRR